MYDIVSRCEKVERGIKKCRVAPHKAGHVVTLHTACVIVLLLACATRVCLYHKSHNQKKAAFLFTCARVF